MFHMTNDLHRFRTRAELEAEGAYAVEGGRLKKGQASYLPLYEGKMVQAFDHRAAWVEVDPTRRHRPGQPVHATQEQHADPAWCPEPQFWVAEQEIAWPDAIGWLLAFKDVTSPTNARTVIAAMVPRCGASNKLCCCRQNCLAHQYLKKVSQPMQNGKLYATN